jgi:hypothetical protein
MAKKIKKMADREAVMLVRELKTHISASRAGAAKYNPSPEKHARRDRLANLFA